MNADARAQDRLTDHVRSGDPRVAFVERTADGSERSLTWRELDTWSRRWMSVLNDKGVRPGDRVAVFAPSSLELVAALVAHHRAGLVHVPVNTRYRRREIDHIVTDSGSALLADEELLRSLHTYEPASAIDVSRDDEATCLLIYTSGTTGRSKGVTLSFRAVTRGIGALTALWEWSASDRLALALPLFHVHGLCIGLHGTLLHRMTAEIQPRFSPAQVVSAFERGATIFMGVPTMYARLLTHLDAHPDDAMPLRRARLFTSGSAALPASDHRRFHEHTGLAILERYGMSETLLTLSNPYGGERRPGSVGFPVPGVEVRIVDDAGAEPPPGVAGEIAVRGPSLMSGYYGLPEATASSYRDGWFMTGDAAFRDEDGYVHIVGRRSVDILKSGGFKISAREIEEVLLEHPAVVEAAVVGLEDPEWGHRIAAVVVVAAGVIVGPVAAALDGHCRSVLASFKRPRQIEVWSELPRNALGKLQKHRIIAALS